MSCRRWMLTVASASACARLAVAAALVLLPVACQPVQNFSSIGGDGDTILKVRVVDADTGRPLPALISFRTSTGAQLSFGNYTDLPGWAQGRSAVELGTGNAGVLAFRHGLALWHGEGSIAVGKPWKHLDVAGEREVQSELPAGLYEVQVSRGVEYDAITMNVDLSAGKGEVSLEVPLTRVVDSTGYLAVDVHVHNAPDSNDAQADAATQLKVAAANGVEVLVSTNHESLLDLSPLVKQMWPEGARPLSTVVGMEKGGMNSHWGVFPLLADVSKPGKGAPLVRTWPLSGFFADLRALSGRPVVVLNHPRLGWQAYMDEGFCGPWAKRDYQSPPPCPQDYDALEVLNGWQSCGTRMREATDTWLALTTYNHVSAALGGSDSHFASAMVPGYPRTWVRVINEDLTAFTPALLAQAIRARHTVASNAPLVTIRSGLATEGDLVTNTLPEVPISIRVQAANWVTVDTVRLLVDGQVVKSWKIPRHNDAVDFRLEETLALGPGDAFVTVETDSQRPLPPYLVGEYNAIIQYGLPKCAPRPGQAPGLPAFAVTSPLFIDRNGDGMFQALRAASPRRL